VRCAKLIALGLAAAALAACQGGQRPVAGVCKPFPAANAAPPAEGAPSLEDCLHRWAYTLAGSRDDAHQVAEAVMAACSAPLARWNQQSLAAAAGASPPQEAPSLLTGESTNPIAEHSNFAGGRALFYVVQARAGACKPPPRRSGSPAMTAPER
jgi:hypothetical protein